MKSLSRYIIESSSAFKAKIDIIEDGKVISSLNARPCYSPTDYNTLQKLERTILQNFFYLGKHPNITFREYIEDKDGNIVHEHKYTPTIRDHKDYSYVVYTYYYVRYTDENGEEQTYESSSDGHYGEYDELKDAKVILKKLNKWSDDDYKDPHIVCKVEAYNIGKVEPLYYEEHDYISDTAEAENFEKAFKMLKKQLAPENIIRFDKCLDIEKRIV